MRFGKRGKARPIAPRRESGAFDEGVVGSVASEERSALLSYGSAEVEAAVLPEGDAFASGDPTQRLVTALGRFHRYVAKGQAGAPQAFWSDDCMNQLTAAIEIALSQDWIHVVESLTDVARVLQSYENAGCANQCVGFLNESYEILSLMVGDLIVNNTASGVINKWRDRYARAVAELNAAGIPLVQDEDQTLIPTEAVSDAEFEAMGDVSFLDLPVPDEKQMAAASRRAGASAPAPESDSLLPFLDAFDREEPIDDEPVRAPSRTPIELPRAAEAAPPVAEAQTDPDVVSILDSLCEDLAMVESTEGPARAELLEGVVDRVALLERQAARERLAAPQEICRRMIQLCRRAASCKKTLDAGFLDLAYAFCETYVEAGVAPESDVVADWQRDCTVLLEQRQPSQAEQPAASEERAADATPPKAAVPPPAKTEAVAAPEPLAEPASPQPTSPESLLGTAQQAAALGNIADAKTLALQAVAQMARTEAAHAETRVQQAEVRLRESGEAIEQARTSVKQVEQDVVASTTRVSARENDLAETQVGVSKAVEKLAAVEQRVAEIDEQIRVLQAAREAEAICAGEAGAELEQIRDEERRAEADLRSLQEAEDATRERLENARQTVKDLQRKRSEIESVLGRNREALMRHQASLADIERTVAQLAAAEQPAAADPDPPGDLLF